MCLPLISKFCCANAKFALTKADKSFSGVKPLNPRVGRPNDVNELKPDADGNLLGSEL